LGVEVTDRRSLDGHVDAIMQTKWLDFGELLSMLSRDELKGICAELGLETSGKEKQVIIERILGGGDQGAEVEVPAAASGRSRGNSRANGSGKSGTEVELPDGVLTRDQLERYLWSAADILRGSIDSSDYKGFIVGLLFLKRLSDRFDEECELRVGVGRVKPDEEAA